jgi:hypothetical protein
MGVVDQGVNRDGHYYHGFLQARPLVWRISSLRDSPYARRSESDVNILDTGTSIECAIYISWQ